MSFIEEMTENKVEVIEKLSNKMKKIAQSYNTSKDEERFFLLMYSRIGWLLEYLPNIINGKTDENVIELCNSIVSITDEFPYKGEDETKIPMDERNEEVKKVSETLKKVASYYNSDDTQMFFYMYSRIGWLLEHTSDLVVGKADETIKEFASGLALVAETFKQQKTL